jgi:DNA modification methylase
VIQGDATTLPFPAQTFDLTITSPPSEMDPLERVRALMEIGRVTRGRIVILANCPGQKIPEPGFYPATPEKTARAMIAVNSEPGDRVLDCFAGHGTIVRVARQMGRRAVGVELNTAYVRRAKEIT